MLDTSARLLKLLSLLQAHHGGTAHARSAQWGRSGAELADRLGISARTVRRDVDRLRELGYPVHSATGTAGGYQLGAGAQMPPLLLDDDEAVAVAVGLRRSTGGGIEGIEETSVRALAKLEQVLPHRLRRRVGALSAYTVPMMGGGTGPAVDPGVLTELAHACRDSERLRFDYAGADGAVTRRTADPHRLVCSRYRWYLVAWDVERDDWRTFRADRITPTPPHGPRVPPRDPPAEDLAAYASRGVSVYAYPTRATVRLRVPHAEAATRISPSAGVLEPDGDDACLLRTGSYGMQAMVVHLLMTGYDFEVVDLPELTGHIRELADRLGRTLAAG